MANIRKAAKADIREIQEREREARFSLLQEQAVKLEMSVVDALIITGIREVGPLLKPKEKK